MWIANLWIGIPTDVTDNVTQGIVEPMETEINNAIQTERTISTLFLIPALTVFGIIIYSIKKQKNRLFSIGLIITIIPILTAVILGLVQKSEMPNKNIILTAISIPLIFGLLKGIKEISIKRKINLKKE